MYEASADTQTLESTMIANEVDTTKSNETTTKAEEEIDITESEESTTKAEKAAVAKTEDSTKKEEITKGTTTVAQGPTTKETTKKVTDTTKKAEAVTKKVEQTKATTTSNLSTKAIYGPGYFRTQGVINWNGWRWTWYSQRVLPGPGLRIPGRHVDDSGFVCDGNDNICLASTKLSKGTIVPTPFGKNGKIYDSGCAYNTLDVYVDW